MIEKILIVIEIFLGRKLLEWIFIKKGIEDLTSTPLTIPVEQVIPGKLLSSRACFRFAC